MNEPLITILLNRNDPIAKRKKVIRDLVQKFFNQSANTDDIDVDAIDFEFTPPCGCMTMKISLEDMPLEDISCKCGKYKLIKYFFK